MSSAASERMDKIEIAAEKWKRDLVDVSGSNRLLRFRHLRTGTLDLTPNGEYKINLRRLESLLAGRSVRLSRVFSIEDERQDARRRMLSIYRTAQENIDEKGIATLFAAIGFATWKSTAGAKPNAPIILIPLTATPTDATRSDFNLEASGDAYLNQVLTYVLGDDYNVDVSHIDDDLADNLPRAYPEITALLDKFKSECFNVPGFEVKGGIAIGNFRYTNMPMVADLDNNLEAFADNDLIAVMAGVEEARQALADNISDPSPSRPDFDPPDTEFLIMDADSSQHKAINRALSGESEVIWGPPGTGKSQVIANMIAALIANGKRVLFVAEKRAAVEVVVARLNAAGLSDLVMDTHGGIGSKREFAKQMAESLHNISNTPEQETEFIHTQLAHNRSLLVDHKDGMHTSRSPWGINVFDIQSRLIGTPKQARAKTRLRASDASQIDLTALEDIKVFANEWVELKGHELDAKHPEWAQSSVNTLTDARTASELAQRIDEMLPAVHSRLRACLGEVGLTPPDSVTDWVALLEWLLNWAQAQPNVRYKADVNRALDLTHSISEKLPQVQSHVHACLNEVGLNSPDTIADWVALLEWLLNWAQAQRNVATKSDLQQALELKQALELVCHINETLPNVLSNINACLGEVGLTPPDTLSEWASLLAWLSDVERFSSQFSDAIYELDHKAGVVALSAANQWYAPIAAVFSSDYRRALKSVRETQVGMGSKVSPEEAFNAVERAADYLSKWQRLTNDGSFPKAPASLNTTTTQVSDISQRLRQLPKFLPTLDDALDKPYAELERQIHALTPPNMETCAQAQVWKLDQPFADLKLTIDQVSDVSQRLRRLMDFLPTLDALNLPYSELERQIQALAPPNMETCVQTQIWNLEQRFADLQSIAPQVSEVSQLLRQFIDFLPKVDALNLPSAELERLINRLAFSQDVARNLPRLRELRRIFADSGVDRITAEAGSPAPPEYTAAAIEWAWLNTIADEILWEDNRLANFNSTTHNRVQKEFVEQDKEHLKTTPNRIKRAAAEAAINAMNTYEREDRLVRQEAQKKRRHISVRNLLRRAPNVLTAIRPCWTMSPLLVAETIPIGAKMFDVVIFDEASQIPPAEAIGSLARAPQTIIAGDDRQLPPTSFFGKQDADIDDADEDNYEDAPITEGMESILDVAKASPLREEMLQWHYRSLDARLIAFSNTHIYNKALTAFPSTELNNPISHSLVPFRSVPGLTSNISHPDEVATVVDMIIQHARQHPTESLGVIAFGSRHAKNIDDALRQRLSELQDASIEDFFSEQAEERFFVKNIERVQGDERDAIILSVGYHKNANGGLPYRFGPLNQEGGERRLNVAVTRARVKLHLVSSFSHYDMEPGRSSALGVELLRQYLEFAASDGAELGATVSDIPLNPFELDVLNGLRDKGIPTTPQYGVAGYRIDFACGHPDQPGRMVMAIEADGASYHSGHTARERDRLRQEALESRGWRFHRIWSTDWFKNRNKEVNKAVKAWKQAVKDADNGYAPQLKHPAVNDSVADTPTPPESTPPKRKGRRPYTNPGQSIDKYSSYQLEALARWILSDTLLRTDDEIMDEMRKELGFKKLGSRIRAALQRTIDRVRVE